MTAKDFRQMRRNNCRRVNDRIACHHSFFALYGRNPDGRQIKGWLPRFHAIDLGGDIARIHGEKMIHQNLCRRHLIALDEK